MTIKLKNSSGWFEEFTAAVPFRAGTAFFISHPFTVLLQFYSSDMKKWCVSILFLVLLSVSIPSGVSAQCSICTKNAQQMGEKPARGMNTGILYLALFPFLVVGYVGYRWYRHNNDNQ